MKLVHKGESWWGVRCNLTQTASLRRLRTEEILQNQAMIENKQQTLSILF